MEKHCERHPLYNNFKNNYEVKIKETVLIDIFILQGHIGFPGVDGGKGEQGNIIYIVLYL